MVSKNDLPEALSQILTSEGQNLAFSAKNGEKPQFSLFGSLRKAGFPSGKMAGNGEKRHTFRLFSGPQKWVKNMVCHKLQSQSSKRVVWGSKSGAGNGEKCRFFPVFSGHFSAGNRAIFPDFCLKFGVFLGGDPDPQGSHWGTLAKNAKTA